MYSRKTGLMYNSSEAQRKIESFNKDLREQYRQRNQTSIQRNAESEPAKQQKSIEALTKVESDKALSLMTGEDMLIIGLIVLLLFEEQKDYLLIGLLAALLFLKG